MIANPKKPPGQSDMNDKDDPLIDEVRACLAAFPLLVKQVREVARVVEQSVIGVCGNFQSMAKRARQGVEAGRAALEQPGEGEGGDLIGGARASIEGLLRHLDEASKASATSAAERNKARMNEGVRALERKLGEIDSVTSALHILALNAKIEAGRAGVHGVGFAVVAAETGEIAKRVKGATGEVRELFSELRTAVAEEEESAAAGGDGTVAAVSALIARGRADATQLLDRLGQSQAALCEATASLSRESEELVADISAAVVTLQFQDNVNQRLAHVAEALEAMTDSLVQRLRGGSRARQPQIDWVGRLQASYTMDAERESQAHASRNGTAGGSPDANVELF